MICKKTFLKNFILNILFLGIIFSQNIFSAGQIRSISIKPEYLCPGQTVTITFEARHELGRQIYAAGVFSTNSTWDTNDYLWLWSNYPTIKSPFDTWDSTKYCSSPSDVTIYLPYTFTVTVPSAFTEGSIIFIIIKVGENFWTVGGTAGSGEDAILAQAFEVNCRKTNAYNRANLWYQQSLPAKLIIEDCLTPSNTPTNTRTNTRTNTPTNTFTDTPTYTRTFTPTNTFTNTSTNTLTYTATNTITNTFTNTPTNTLTNTRTNTLTSTETFTRTFTLTNTITNTFTNTQTNTSTNTITNTFTNTITNTSTNSFTQTFTRTNSPTNTLTNTPTNTFTRTFTATETWTGTQPPTWTSTNTFTNTNTQTNTATATDTPTRTNTVTPTDTFTPTYTRTNTSTSTETQTGTPLPTWTLTNTFTYTRTNTPSFTGTNTFTSTNTPTNTNTITNTQTYTNTYLPTATNTFTTTNTRTNTSTPTNTNTMTHTYTQTASFTITDTATDTPTTTATPTITLTLPPFPYTITIGIYNEAGEIVRKIISTQASGPIEKMILKAGDEESNIIDTKNELKIILPGIETPETSVDTAAVFIWDLKNNNGQIVDNGVYYIKIEQKDGFGHTNILIKDIHILNIDEYVELRIFNSAGEIINVIRYDKSFKSNNVFLKVNDVIAIGNDNQEISIIYGDEVDDSIKWDGKNAQGLLVTSGIYEMQITVKKNNEVKTISKTVKIFSFAKKYLSNLRAIPNPYKGQKDKINFIWDTDTKGEIFIKIYNIAGEIIRTLDGKLEDKILNWDVRTSTGASVTPGLYIYIMEARSEDGAINIMKSKLVIMNN